MADENKETNGKKCVLVTGASGYIALHCVQQLLEAGYQVRGTVRSLCDPEKVGPIRDLKYSADRLELVEADLECAEHWPDAVHGCTYILHVASPWPIVADESTINIAKEGTLNVLKAAAETKTVRKVVLTSSCAAINDGHKNKSRVFNETCWADLNSKRIENYGKSKVISERAAWDFWNSLPERSRFELTVLNPTFVVGPVLSAREHGSATVIKRMMDYRTFPGIPKISLGVVDVRDVARAHIRALKAPNTNGERILITAVPSVWFTQMTEWLHKEFKKQGYVISRLSVPNWLVRLYAKANIDPHVAALKYRFGSELRFDNTKSKKLLGIDYTPPHKSIVDMAYSMIDYGMIKPRTKRRSKSVDMLDNNKENKESTVENDNSKLITVDNSNNIKASMPDLSSTKEVTVSHNDDSKPTTTNQQKDSKQKTKKCGRCAKHAKSNNQNDTKQANVGDQDDSTKQSMLNDKCDANQIKADQQNDIQKATMDHESVKQIKVEHQNDTKELNNVTNPENLKKPNTIEQNGIIPSAKKPDLAT